MDELPDGEDPIDELFADMDEEFFKEGSISHNFDDIHLQDFPVPANSNGLNQHIPIDPFAINDAFLRRNEPRSMVRNSKSMMDFTSLPSARRMSFNRTESPTNYTNFLSNEGNTGQTMQNELEALDQSDIFQPTSTSLENSFALPLATTVPKSVTKTKVKRPVRKKSEKKVEFDMNSLAGKSTSSSKLNKETNEEKRQRRLARNRESARQSRRRKKQQLENIEQQVVNLALDVHQERETFFKAYLNNRRENKLKELKEMQTIQDENVLKQKLESYDSTFGVLDLNSKLMRQYHFDHAFGLLLPPYFKFFLHIINTCSTEIGTRKKFDGEAEEAVPNISPSTSWDRFCRELNLTGAQKEKVKADLKVLYSSEAENEQKKLHLLSTYLQGLQNSFELRTTVVHTQFKAVIDSLEPAQVSKLLLHFEQCFDDSKSEEEFSFTTEELEKLIVDNDVNLDDGTKTALELLKKDDSDISFDDLQSMLRIVSR